MMDKKDQQSTSQNKSRMRKKNDQTLDDGQERNKSTVTASQGFAIKASIHSVTDQKVQQAAVAV